ncbi:alpha/beta fold hydrolase [Streptomyces sp. NPDC056399]|uniref:alpha/beta fold hydrolase n=1 Tax=Streptomyces sp. NPDC056399 TaxID=3345807 RepID=UPI0035E0F194
MTPFNVREYVLARAHLDGRDPGGLERDLAARADAIGRDPVLLLDDLRAELSPHDLPVVEDPRVRTVLLWHGLDDAFSPVSHTRWLAGRIPGAEPVLVPEAGHFAAQWALPDVLRWLDGQGAGR